MWEPKPETTLRYLFHMADQVADSLFKYVKNDKALRKHVDRKVKEKEEEFELIFGFREAPKKTKRSLRAEHIVTKEIFRNLFSREEVERNIRGGISSKFFSLSMGLVCRLVSRLHPGRESGFMESLLSASKRMANNELGAGYGEIFQKGINVSIERGKEYYAASQLEEDEILNDAVIRRFCDEVAARLEADCSRRLFKHFAPYLSRLCQEVVLRPDFLEDMGLT